MKKAVLAAACVLAVASGPVSARVSNKTLYPIVFAHGMAGFDDILGYDYWGDDYGYYVLDPYANWDIDWYQKSFVASVTPFQSSEQRGYELYQDILGYMASSGAQYVNNVGHSQGASACARPPSRSTRTRAATS
jgi:triacylglycerol lipase